MKQGNGLIVFYTLKNPSFPESAYETDSGVMCLDIHPDHPYQVAAGFYDGSVAVFNTVEKKDGPVHRCTAKNGKHTDPVWQVRISAGDVIIIIHCFHIALFSALEQAHCTHVTCDSEWVAVSFFQHLFLISMEVVYW